MQSLQTAIVEVMEACLQELRETNLVNIYLKKWAFSDAFYSLTLQT